MTHIKRQVVKIATQQQIKLYFDTLGPIVKSVCKKRGYGDVQAYTCLCQGALETGYSTSGSLMTKANAMFGIKASKSWLTNPKYGGKVYSAKTKECYDGSNFVTITDTFRAYDSLEDSVNDYFDLMESGRYKPSLTARSVPECIGYIARAGYATDPNYANKIISIYNSNKKYMESTTVPNADIYYPIFIGSTDSIVQALKSLGIDSSYAFRAKIAKVNNVANYRGTASQNTYILNLLKEGKLKRV